MTRAAFLRSLGDGEEEVVPLAPIRSPDVSRLPQVPAVLTPVGDLSQLSAAVDPGLAREAFRRAAATPGVRQLLVEDRAYYPVSYRQGDSVYSAVIDAGPGGVWASRLPARPQSREGLVAVSASAVLLAEAWLVPGLPAKVAVLGLSALALRGLLPRLVGARG